MIKKPTKKPSESSWMKKMKESGLNPKKEILIVAVADVLILAFGVYLYILQKSIYPLFSIFAVIAIADYFYLNRHSSLIQKRKTDDEQEFIRLFTYFSIYVKDGIPVYTALELTSRFASESMKNKLDTLLKEIDMDKSIMPYLNFSSYFSSLTIREVMVSIYRMVEEGGSSLYARQFEYLFEGLATMKRKEDHERRIKRLNDLTFLPVIASGFTMIVLSYGVVGIIGGMSANGI